MKLKKIDSITYACGAYVLEKKRAHRGKGFCYVWKLYKSGCYIGEPSTIADANRWIKHHEI